MFQYRPCGPALFTGSSDPCILHLLLNPGSDSRTRRASRWMRVSVSNKEDADKEYHHDEPGEDSPGAECDVTVISLAHSLA